MPARLATRATAVAKLLLAGDLSVKRFMRSLSSDDLELLIEYAELSRPERSSRAARATVFEKWLAPRVAGGSQSDSAGESPAKRDRPVRPGADSDAPIPPPPDNTTWASLAPAGQSGSRFLVSDSGAIEMLAPFLGSEAWGTFSLDDFIQKIAHHYRLSCMWCASYSVTDSPTALLQLLEKAAGETTLPEVRLVADWPDLRTEDGERQALKLLSFGARLAPGVPLGSLDENLEPHVELYGFREAESGAKFHPKVYLLDLYPRKGPGTSLHLGLIGSANLSGGGFWSNDELGILFAWHSGLGETGSFQALARAERVFERWRSTASRMRWADLVPNRFEEQTDKAPTPALHYFQRRAVRALVGALEHEIGECTGGRDWEGALLVLPPASGKTIIALNTVRELLERGALKRVLWVSHSPKLAGQAALEFVDRVPTPVGSRTQTYVLATPATVLSASEAHLGVGCVARPSDIRALSWVTFAGIQYLHRKAKRRPGGKLEERFKSLKPDLIVVDECHHAHDEAKMFRDLLRFNASGSRGAPVLGLTATPYVTSPKHPRTPKWRKHWERISRLSSERKRNRAVISSAGTFALSLSDVRREVATMYSRPVVSAVMVCDSRGTLVDFDRLVVNSGEVRWRAVGRSSPSRYRYFKEGNPAEGWDSGDQEGQVGLEVFGGNWPLVQRILQQIDNRVVAGIRERTRDPAARLLVYARSIRHAQKLGQRLGGEAVTYHSHLKQAERDAALGAFRKGEIRCIVSVNMIAEGSNLPELTDLFLPRWTTSDRLLWQLIGRGIRGPAAGGGTSHVNLWLYELQFSQPRGEFRVLSALQEIYGDPSEGRPGLLVDPRDPSYLRKPRLVELKVKGVREGYELA